MNDPELFSKLQELLDQDHAVVLCTIIGKTGSSPRGEGAKMLVDHKGTIYGTVGGGNMERRLVVEALGALGEGKPKIITFALGVKPTGGAIPINSRCGGEVTIFIDILRPEVKAV